MESNLVQLLKTKSLTIAAAESYTGGLFSSYITSIPGASLVFKGSIVAYSNEAKMQFLNIKKSTFDLFGAVSSECAKEMALQCQLLFKTDVAISFTGNAGPKALEDKPVGEVYVCIVFHDQIHSFPLQLKGTRKSIRKQSITFAIQQIFDIISKV